MKAKLEFDLTDPEERQNLDYALQGQTLVFALEDVHNKVWRPYYKHGYNKEIEDLIEMCPNTVDKDGLEYNVGYLIIEKLHDIYRRVLFEEYDIKL